jgi:glycosyltransferase involved in cell wall biosynthesis
LRSKEDFSDQKRGRQMKISATILTKNSEKYIEKVLKSLEWCDEVVVLDSGSTDATLDIARSFANCRVHVLEGEFLGFGLMHQKMSALAKNDWILSVDSDEVVSDELKAELQNLAADKNSVYMIPSKNYFNGKHIYSCGWYPDYKARFFNKSVTDFNAEAVHENVVLEGRSVVYLKSAFLHYSYDGVDDFLKKMHLYSSLFARQNVGKKSASPAKAVLRALWAFIKTYILKGGIRQGYEGFVISAYNAQTTFWKYIKLYEENKRQNR